MRHTLELTPRILVLGELISELETDISELRQQVWALTRERQDLLNDLAEFKVGDIVEAERYVTPKGGSRYNQVKEWQPAIIRKVYVTEYSVSYELAWRNKNGQWSSQIKGSWSYGAIRRPETEPVLA